MPIKSPGGYLLIDLKGFVITSEQNHFTDPDVLKIFAELYDNPDKRGKPVYITNYECASSGLHGTPLLMRDEMENSDSMRYKVDEEHIIVINFGGLYDYVSIYIETL